VNIEELRPCPFCGGEAEIIHLYDGDNEGGSCVQCKKCFSSGNVEFDFKENFIKNWNRRMNYKMTKEEFDSLLAESLKENMTIDLSYNHSYGYGCKVISLHVKYNGETIAIQELDLN
jgi:Lar family restriction alleviation protein